MLGAVISAARELLGLVLCRWRRIRAQPISRIDVHARKTSFWDDIPLRVFFGLSFRESCCSATCISQAQISVASECPSVICILRCIC